MGTRLYRANVCFFSKPVVSPKHNWAEAALSNLHAVQVEILSEWQMYAHERFESVLQSFRLV